MATKTNNPARVALSRAVNRAIANGAPVIGEKPTLAALRSRVDVASRAFDTACRPHYCDGRWGAYRDIENGRDVNTGVLRALDEYHGAMHAYYLARDGEHGFLGGKGV